MRIEFPSPAFEERDSAHADAIYESATKWLLERTRDTRRYALLFKENISYGFRRNMLGLRPYGVGISMVALVWALAASGLAQARDHPFDFRRILDAPPTHLIAVVGSGMLLLMWLVGTTSTRVKIAAFAYAERLLAACESIESAQLKARKTRNLKAKI